MARTVEKATCQHSDKVCNLNRRGCEPAHSLKTTTMKKDVFKVRLARSIGLSTVCPSLLLCCALVCQLLHLQTNIKLPDWWGGGVWCCFSEANCLHSCHASRMMPPTPAAAAKLLFLSTSLAHKFHTTKMRPVFA